MSDMLVSLMNLPDVSEEVRRLKESGITIRKVHTWEPSLLRSFVENQFSEAWADEVDMAFSSRPPTCYVATHDKKIIGFAAYECTSRDYFGPTGVDLKYRGKGIGTALLVCALRSLREMGYVYAVIGGAGPTEFYENQVGAFVIPNSVPGVYTDPLDRLPETSS